MTDGSRGIHLTDGIHPTDRRVKMEMRRIATLEIIPTNTVHQIQSYAV